MTAKTIFADALASIAVFFVALPLCMAVAIASGFPPSAGLITGIVGGVVVGALQGTPLQVSGPAAGLTIIVLDLLRAHGSGKLAVIVFLAGLLQIAGAILRGARLFRAVPPAVIAGMLAGIGVIVFSAQFHVMIDDRPSATTLANLLTIPRALRKAVQLDADLPHEEAALVGVLCIAVLLGWSRIKSKIGKFLPGPLVAIITVSLLANLLKFPISYVRPPSNLLDSTMVPSLAALRVVIVDPHCWLAAAGLALVASAETLLCSVATDQLSTLHKADLNKELLAQGVGNALCGLLGVLPLTGVVVRTSVNVNAGGRTRLSAILHGVWLLVLVLLGAKLLRYVPTAGLAAVLVYSGIKLMTQQSLKELRQLGKAEVFAYFATIIAIVFLGLLKGVVAGLAIGTVAILIRLSRCQINVRDDATSLQTELSLVGAATFLSLPALAEALEKIEPNRKVTFNYAQVTLIDSGVLQLIKTWTARHQARGGSVEVDFKDITNKFFATIPPPPMPAKRPSLAPAPARD